MGENGWEESEKYGEKCVFSSFEMDIFIYRPQIYFSQLENCFTSFTNQTKDNGKTASQKKVLHPTKHTPKLVMAVFVFFFLQKVSSLYIFCYFSSDHETSLYIIWMKEGLVRMKTLGNLWVSSCSLFVLASSVFPVTTFPIIIEVQY